MARQKIALYARYSSDLQNPRSCEAQVQELAARAERDGHEASRALVLSDSAVSGTTWQRPGLQELVQRIEAGEVKTLYVEAPDRLSRDPEDSARLSKLFHYHRVSLVALNGAGLDGSPGSALVFGVMAAVSDNYLRELGSKTKRCLKDSARQGKATGGKLY